MSVISYFGGKSSNVFIEFINSKIPNFVVLETLNISSINQLLVLDKLY